MSTIKIEPPDTTLGLDNPMYDPSDPDYDPSGSGANSGPNDSRFNKFRVTDLQAAVALNDKEFANFTAQLRMLMKQLFDVRCLRSQQPDAIRAFKNTLLEEFPRVMDGNTEEKLRLVNHYLSCAYGAWRHSDKYAQHAANNEIADDEEEGRRTPSSLTSGSPRQGGDASSADSAITQGLRGLSVSTPPASAASPKADIVPSSQSPPSSQKELSDLSAGLLNPSLMSFSDPSNVNKRATASLTPPKTPHKAGSKSRPNKLQKVRNRSPSLELLSAPPPGSFPPASAKRRKISSDLVGPGIRVPTQSKSPQKPKRTQRPQVTRPPPIADSPTKRRQAVSTATVSPQRRTNTDLSSLLPSLSASRLPSSSSSFSPVARSAPGTSTQGAQLLQPKKEVIAIYSGKTPALEEAGIRLFLRSCKPSMEHFLPAFVEAKCTLPVLEAVSAWSPKDMDEIWIPKIRKIVEEMRSEPRAAGTSQGKPSTMHARGDRVDETKVGGAEGMGRTGGNSGTTMRELTAMDGVILGYHLKEFWKTHS